ncbi:hypothetical protein WN944_012939 [Citrus x changshan-huyou]|uniref:Uncharacterized protein n=1 Tax=Citrus x changshan-huyou TaxID=2935761 RepID=A0AAP0M703_9ROSI
MALVPNLGFSRLLGGVGDGQRGGGGVGVVMRQKPTWERTPAVAKHHHPEEPLVIPGLVLVVNNSSLETPCWVNSIDSKAAVNEVGHWCEERTPAVAYHHHPPVEP